jgi:hypothetical protein
MIHIMCILSTSLVAFLTRHLIASSPSRWCASYLDERATAVHGHIAVQKDACYPRDRKSKADWPVTRTSGGHC